MSGDKHFNAEKVFAWLFVLTMLEVAWGVGGAKLDWGKLMLWGGLLFFAFFKGWLIAVYFMHLKFEGWVVKSLILPTPFLVMVIFGYVAPDVGHPDHLEHPVGSMFDPETGEVYEHMEAHAEVGDAARSEPGHE
jgi:caa(3)-type oxidase subunit IV